ncbi:hypothetical protein QQX98_006861 [Neonectria punicea]|uniref:non-specific serine/threonine protein kinase n=1 Tax=Neonectria punicea TaxID=979145 RepID=A0ABR1GZK5_9HYPO
MADHGDLPELVRDSKLPTILQHDLTIHAKPPGRRNAPRQAIWRQERILGHGGYGVVSLQRRWSKGSATPDFRAVKQIQISNPGSGVGSFVHELEALAKFSQDKYADFFVKSQGWYLDSESLYIAMEYCECGDLRAYLAEKNTLPEDEAQDIAAQVLGGLSLMHEVGFAHRDIKPANILIKSKPPDDWWVKVCDLGLSKRTSGVAASMTVRGTPGFMPPETIGLDGNPRVANPLSADMWCFGETVYQMLIGSPAFSSYPDLADYHKGSMAFPSEAMKKASASESAVDFIQSLMKASPGERLTAGQALEHPWMMLAVEQTMPLPDLSLLSTTTRRRPLSIFPRRTS